MCHEWVAWIALLTASAALLAWVRFWIDMGKYQQRIDDAVAERQILTAKISLVDSSLNEHRVYVASTYATDKALSEGLHGINQRLDNIQATLLSMARNQGA